MPETPDIPKQDIADILQLACGLSSEEANDSAWAYELTEETADTRIWSVTHPTLGGLTFSEPKED